MRATAGLPLRRHGIEACGCTALLLPALLRGSSTLGSRGFVNAVLDVRRDAVRRRMTFLMLSQGASVAPSAAGSGH